MAITLKGPDTTSTIGASYSSCGLCEEAIKGKATSRYATDCVGGDSDFGVVQITMNRTAPECVDMGTWCVVFWHETTTILLTDEKCQKKAGAGHYEPRRGNEARDAWQSGWRRYEDEQKDKKEKDEKKEK